MKDLLKHAGRICAAFVMCAGLLSLAPKAMAQQNPDADNTKSNTGDAQSPVTADAQKENHSDREITRQIRRALIGDKTLSTYAHNVKIITQDGIVTLRGPVRSDAEKQAVEAKAIQVAGTGKVSSQLEVKPAQ